MKNVPIGQSIRWIEKITETPKTQNAIKDIDLSYYNLVYLKIKELFNFREGTEDCRS